ncbi:MAG: hypothetical protein AMXMBFR84_18640 [Candidatus Hydrogenedentota bacterium]
MNVRIVSRYLPLALLLAIPAALRAADESPHAVWEKAIAAFEEKDKTSPPPKHANLFVGSSSIRLWKVEEAFPEYEVINRGFGGSEIADSTHFADRIILPYEPDVIVFYAGDNDMAKGKSPQQILEDYKAFVAKVHGALPQTKIVYISIKPSVARWALYSAMEQANGLIKEETETSDLLEFVDIAPAMIGEDGKPKADLLLEDGLHLNEEGYKRWNDAVRPHLKPKA